MAKSSGSRDIKGRTKRSKGSPDTSGGKQAVKAGKSGVKGNKRNTSQGINFFRGKPKEVGSGARFEFVEENRKVYGISKLCRSLQVSPQGYYKWQESKTRPHKHAGILAEIQAILEEDAENENYGRQRLLDALNLRGHTINESTLYRILKEHGIMQKPNKPKGLTKADKAAHKSDNLINRDFTASKPNEKLVSDITMIKTKDGNLYVSGIFDCYDNFCVGLSMATNMKTPLVIESLEAAHNRFGIRGAIFHTDRGSQYTSFDFRAKLEKLGVIQSMNSDGGRCHDNAKCESMWARLKAEKIFKVNTQKMPIEEVKTMIFRYFMGYWNNRRICHAIGGMPPALKRQRYFDSLLAAA